MKPKASETLFFGKICTHTYVITHGRSVLLYAANPKVHKNAVTVYSRSYHLSQVYDTLLYSSPSTLPASHLCPPSSC